MPPTSWTLRPADEARATALARELELPRPMARVLVARGFGQLEAAQGYLEPRLGQLTNPASMAALQKALDRLMEAFEAGQPIGVFGDYDVDGVSSSAMVGDYLRRCGAEVSLRVARRDEGYGFHVSQAQELIDRGVQLLVLTDTGTHDVEAVAHAQQAGVDVIALDHHRVGELDWPGFALVNPHRPDCAFPYKGLCAAGLAFYVMAALRRRLEAEGRAAVDPRENLDLVALATLADVAPLDGDNRILVAHGLRGLERTERPGLKELLRLCDLKGRRPTAMDVGWRLGPRLNAPGRLGDASVSLDCLAQRDERAAVESARRCDTLNEQRKDIQRKILDAARAQAEQQGDAPFLLVADEDWHPGVIGIVAGRLSEEFDRPAAVVALEGDTGRASARSVEGVDLFAVLSRCRELMVRYGGHAAAAGFTVERSQLEPLRGALAEAAAQALAERPAPSLMLDAELSLAEIDFGFCRQVARLGPHGEGNPTPLFVTRSARVESAQIVGADHLRLALRQDRAVRQAIGFGLAEAKPPIGSLVDVAYAAEIDHYQGVDRLRLRLVALSLASSSDGESTVSRGG
jgi:single-stranded-DNA-specific exonuclease